MHSKSSVLSEHITAESGVITRATGSPGMQVMTPDVAHMDGVCVATMRAAPGVCMMRVADVAYWGENSHMESPRTVHITIWSPIRLSPES